MRLQYKLSIPMVAVVLVLGAASYYFIGQQLQGLERHNFEQMATSKVSEVEQSIARAGERALAQASLYSRDPLVIQAFEQAAQGDINDPANPEAQSARELLRQELGSKLAGYEKAMGGKLKLHFHLPNGRSLLRVWRDKQTKKNGQWVDISDDISSFRQTVLDVNSTGSPVKGIELGRGGFVVRGLAPVVSDNGRRLGSVETLLDFGPIMESASKSAGQSLVLYMNADKLNITTKLQDAQKNPKVGSNFVLVADTHGKLGTALPEDGLLQARQGVHYMKQGGLPVAAFPIKDYKGQQIGVMAYAMDTTAQNAFLREVEWTLIGVLALVMILPLAIASVVISKSVSSPVGKIVAKIKDIAEDRADLKERLDDSQRDEIGELATWFNRLMGKLDEIMCGQEGLINMLNAVPDPIFAVDDNYRILHANKATQKFLGKSEDELRKGCCSDFFQTEVCGTEKCPIAIAKKRNGLFEADVINIGTDGEPIYIQPVGDVLFDCHGKKVGYVEVARVVTDVIVQRIEADKNLDTVCKVNEQTLEAAESIASASEQIMSRVGEVNSGAALQRDRAGATATAMEEMNATVLEVARSASNASQQAEAARLKAEDGADIVAKAVDAISRVKERAEVMKRNMDELGTKADGIGQIMNVISDIADQTNLLALNAAIEAARAGDAGRGFAVVADEVRKLAEKTMHATKEVGDAISAIQQGTNDNIHQVDAASSAVEEAVELASSSGQALAEIVALVNATSDQVRGIATAAEQQSATSDEINQAVDEVNRIAGETADGMNESMHALAELSSLAERLKGLAAA